VTATVAFALVCAGTTRADEIVDGEYIVVLEEEAIAELAPGAGPDTAVQDAATALLGRHGGKLLEVWDAVLPTFAVEMSEAEARELGKAPAVRWLTPDLILDGVFPTPTGGKPGTLTGGSNCPDPFGQQCGLPTPPPPDLSGPAPWTQTIVCSDPSAGCADNWALDRIQGGRPRDGFFDFGYPSGTAGNGAAGTGRGVHIYIYDSRIRTDHREFQGRIGAGFNATGEPAGSSCFLHATMVAGIAAGSTYGVAKEATIHPVQIARCSDGSTRMSWLISGLNWIAQNHQAPAVVNISLNLRPATVGNDCVPPMPPNLCEPFNLEVMSAWVRRLIVDHGITVVNSAGNLNRPACSDNSPSDVPEVILVGATQQVDGGADGRWVTDPCAPTNPGPQYGSNYGSCLDVWAPGAHVVSADFADPGGGCRWTGTSFAAPVVAGWAAVILEQLPDASPAEVEFVLTRLAECNQLPVGSASPQNPYSIRFGSPNALLRYPSIPLRLARLRPGACPASP
jgi:subtilisin family serine protease